MFRKVFLLALSAFGFMALCSTAICAEPIEGSDIFAKDNLVAWCVVPFDAAKRGPEARAEMLAQLGFTKLAYDWRAEHVPTFEAEILALKKHNIEFFAFWGEHESMFLLFEKYDIRPQIWKTAPSPRGEMDPKKRVEAAVEQLMPVADRTAKLGCKLGLYNHGGWGGEPENLVAVCRQLRRNTGSDHIGIVYNLHHGHGHIDDFAQSLAIMKPYLLCLNLNGMNEGASPKILAIGQGRRDSEILKIIEASGYHGPLGILDHQNDKDAKITLQANLNGLDALTD